MTVYDVIDAKKKKRALTAEQIGYFVARVADGGATDSQIAAFCMATLLNGMTDEECFALTKAMAASGEKTPRPAFSGLCADKHSTGGVSDSTTLILVPVLCALGVRCAKYSGRGLGHTGGTLDKLQSIPGLRVDLTAEEFERQVQDVGGAIAGQTDRTVPADKRMYAVRDVTATVDSIPLIASSVMSKKLASFADVILLDVKTGDGAFMREPERAEELARLMVRIGKAAGRRVCAAVTDMSAPLGDSIGCNAEVREAIGVLRGDVRNALAELSLFHARKILRLVRGISEPEAARETEQAIESGAALKKLEEIVAAQGGDIRALYDETLLPLAEVCTPVRAHADGVLRISALALGKACVELGGGRKRAEDAIDHTVGFRLKKRAGERVRAGETLAEMYSRGEAPPEAVRLAASAFSVEESYRVPPLIYRWIGEEEI